MANSRYYWLLAQKLQRQLSANEKTEFQELSAKEAEPGLEQEISRLWEATGAYGSAYKPDTEAALRKLRVRMAAEDHPRITTWQRIRRPLAIAASVLLLLTAGWGWWNQRTTIDWVSVTTQVGQTQVLKLSDGTEVTLNGNSTLRYPFAFDGLDSRNIELQGEAFFKVAHRPEQPFLVLTEQAEVKVLGTQFNVRAYPHELNTELTVAAGLVAFTDKAHQGTPVKLAAGQGALMDENGKIEPLAGDTENYYAWQSGKLSFKNTRLKEALPLIERYYQVDIQWDDAALSDCPARLSGGNWNRSGLTEMKDYLLLMTNMTLEAVEPGVYRLSGTCR